MRSVHRGITTTFVIIIILASVVTVTAVYLSSYQIQKQKLSQINSFEECAKHYPVMESYPEQCNTPDGKHFINELTVEKKNLLPLTSPSVFEIPNQNEVNSWSFYNLNNKLSFKYPKDIITIEDRGGGAFALLHKDYPTESGFNNTLGFITEPVGIYKNYEQTYQKAKADPGSYELKIFSEGFLMKQDIGYPLDGKRHYYMMYVYWRSPKGEAISAEFKDYVDGDKIFEKILSTVKILK